MDAQDELRDRIARALFMQAVGAESAPAWDAPGAAGRQRWWDYADAVLAVLTVEDVPHLLAARETLNTKDNTK